MDAIRAGRSRTWCCSISRLDGRQSGLDLHERLRAEGWNIPAILVTGVP